MFTRTSSEHGLSRPITTTSLDSDSATGARLRQTLGGHLDLPSSVLVPNCEGLEGSVMNELGS